VRACIEVDAAVTLSRLIFGNPSQSCRVLMPFC